MCEAIAPEQVVVDKAALLADAKPLTVSNQQMAKQVTKPAQSCSEEAITARVNDWADAWRHKDFDSYSKFYADNFVPEPPLSHVAWVAQRKQRLSTSGKINLEISNLKVTCDGDKATAAFDQDYSVTTYKLLKKQSDGAGCEVYAAKRVATKGFTDKVNKELYFEKQSGEKQSSTNAGQYQIVRELVNK